MFTKQVRSIGRFDIDLIDDTDYRGIYRARGVIHRLARATPTYHNHFLTDPCANRIHGNERFPRGLPRIRCQRLDHLDRAPDQLFVLSSSHDGSGHSCDQHKQFLPQRVIFLENKSI
jgi:hypothetical protein